MRARHEVLALSAALAVLLLSAPSPSSAVVLVRQAQTATDPTGPLVAAVALAAWALAIWSSVVVTVVLLSQVPGPAGRAATAVGRRIAPSAVRRTLELALGISVTVSAVGVPAAAASTPGPGATAQAGSTEAAAASTATPAVPSLDWPVLGGADPVQAPPTATRPAVPSPAGTSSAATPPARTPAAGAPPAAAPPAGRPPGTSAATSAAVVVAPGDSLWALAEAHLVRNGTVAPTDRQIAAAWPTWWAANRDTVGDDPDLIRPGAVLRPPPA